MKRFFARVNDTLGTPPLLEERIRRHHKFEDCEHVEFYVQGGFVIEDDGNGTGSWSYTEITADGKTLKLEPSFCRVYLQCKPDYSPNQITASGYSDAEQGRYPIQHWSESFTVEGAYAFSKAHAERLAYVMPEMTVVLAVGSRKEIFNNDGWNKWEKGFGYLLDYFHEHGNCKVPGEYVDHGYDLGAWMEEQRKAPDRLQRKLKDTFGNQFEKETAF